MVRLHHVDFPSQNQTFPEERSAGRSSPAHQRRLGSGDDDPRLVQSLPATGNGKTRDPAARRRVSTRRTPLTLTSFYRSRRTTWRRSCRPQRTGGRFTTTEDSEQQFHVETKSKSMMPSLDGGTGTVNVFFDIMSLNVNHICDRVHYGSKLLKKQNFLIVNLFCWNIPCFHTYEILHQSMKIHLVFKVRFYIISMYCTRSYLEYCGPKSSSWQCG